MQRIPTLVGITGHFIGEVFPLEYGKTLSVGRSRTADFSVRRTKHYKAQKQDQRDADKAAHTISSKHFQITMFNLNSIEIKNISPNGTVVDDKKITSVLINDIASRTHEIRFGSDEVLRLEMREHADS